MPYSFLPSTKEQTYKDPGRSCPNFAKETRLISQKPRNAKFHLVSCATGKIEKKGNFPDKTQSQFPCANVSSFPLHSTATKFCRQKQLSNPEGKLFCYSPISQASGSPAAKASILPRQYSAPINNQAVRLNISPKHLLWISFEF